MSGRPRRNRRAAEPLGGGRCPLCNALLGVPPAKNERTQGWLAPSLRLEVAGDPRERATMTWRLSVVGRSGKRHVRTSSAGRHGAGEDTTPNLDASFDDEDGPAVVDTAAQRGAFVADDVRYVYLLCGNGHYFLEEDRGPGGEDLSLWRQHAFVAALGPVASGKSYLLVRALNQPLMPLGNDFPDAGGTVRIERVGLADPLESVPKDTLEEHYAKTRRAVTPIPSTARNELVPGAILEEVIADEIRKAAKSLQTRVMGRNRADFDEWGQTIRQPIFVRTRKAGQPVLTCVADLAGELFDRETGVYVGLTTLPMIQHCTELVWVVDPFSSGGRFERFLKTAVPDEAEYGSIVEGSARPDESRAGDPAKLRRALAERDEINDRLGSDFVLDFGPFVSPLGGTLYNLVAITKCDLVQRALQKSRLEDLGDSGRVLEGVARYLDYVIDRRFPVLAADDVQSVVDYLQVGAFDGPARDTAQRRRVQQLATALLEHYSRPDRFWNLVHGGEAETVELTNDGLVAELDELEVPVPSLDAHLAACLQPDGGSLLQMRDLLLSAVGCGVMYGLGQRDRVAALFDQRWRDVRFFLCSPLAMVPSYEPASTQQLDDQSVMPPCDHDREYPRVEEPSAGLTQLQLRIMRRALP